MAEDVTQETFMIAACGVHRYKSALGPFRSWLFGIAQNRHRKQISSRIRRQQRENRYAQDRPENCLPGSAEMFLVREILGHLNKQDRSVLEAKYLDAKTFTEIAQEHQISEHAAESRLRRAKARFAEAYERHQNHAARP